MSNFITSYDVTMNKNYGVNIKISYQLDNTIKSG